MNLLLTGFMYCGILLAQTANAAEMLSAASVPVAAMEHAGHGDGGEHAQHGQPQAAHEWTSHPLIVRATTKGADERGAPVMMIAKNFQPDNLFAYAPSGDAPRDLERTPGGAKLEALPKVGNYYWVTAREEQGDRITVASTSYYFSNPGPAPGQMLLAQKHELELIPQPLPREHNSYRENEDWKFLLRFNGQPLPDQVIKLETKNGSKVTFTSDAQGIATVRFPEDFKQVAEKREGGGGHDHGPRRAPFVLETEYATNGKQYLTAFNSTYSPDAYTGRSLALGAGFTLFGMVLASPMLRRKPGASKKQGAVAGNAVAVKGE